MLRTKSGGATTVDSSLHSLNSSCRYVSARVRCIIKRRSEALTHDGQKHFAHRLPAQVQARKVGLRLVGRASGQCTPRAPKLPLKAVRTCANWPLLVPVSDPFQVRLWSWQQRSRNHPPALPYIVNTGLIECECSFGPDGPLPRTGVYGWLAARMLQTSAISSHMPKHHARVRQMLRNTSEPSRNRALENATYVRI